MTHRSSRFVLIVVRALWGTALLVAPGRVLRLIGGADEARTATRLVRVLGARHLLQAIAGQALGDRAVAGQAVRIGVWIDGLHALSDLGFACRDVRWRRASATDAAIASGFAAFGLYDLGADSRARSR